MRIYVAASSAELLRAIAMRDALRAAGHEITEDWMSKVTAQLAVGRGPNDLSPEARRRCADADYVGVSSAHRVVLLVPQQPIATQGAWWEAGIADGLDIPIIAAGRPEDRARNIFLARAIEVDTDEAALGLCREDIFAKYQAAQVELARVKDRLETIEAGIADMAAKLALGPAESERLYEGVLARR